MLALALYSGFAVSPPMAELRAANGAMEKLPADVYEIINDRATRSLSDALKWGPKKGRRPEENRRLNQSERRQLGVWFLADWLGELKGHKEQKKRLHVGIERPRRRSTMTWPRT